MIDVERTLLEAGADIRTMVTASIDVDADLRATLQRRVTTSDETSLERSRSLATPLMVGSAAALVALLVGVLVVVSDGNDEVNPTGTIDISPRSTLAPATTIDVATSIAESTLPDGSVPTSSTPVRTDVSVVLPPQPVAVPVSYLDPPETYEPDVFATIGVDDTVEGSVGFAVGDGIVAITGPGPRVTVLDVATGSTSTQSLSVEINYPVLGPGGVLYGLSFTPSTDPRQAEPDAAIVAQSLDTDPSTVVNSVVVSANTYVEVPMGTFVAGPDGVYDLHRARGKVMDYVDAAALGAAMPMLALEDPQGRPVVRTIDGSVEWIIAVEADPNAAGQFVGPTPPAPGPDGTTRVIRYIGPQLETEPADFGTPTRQVVADLAPGGGRWWSLPDGWSAVTSSSYGTLLAGNTPDGQVDLAWFDPEPPPAVRFEPTSVLAANGDGFVAIDRDELGVEARQEADSQIGWPNGCTFDGIEALFAQASAGAVLERVACDRRLTTVQSEPMIVAGDFFTDGVRSSVQLVDDPTSGLTTELDDATALRFANTRTSPIVRSGTVPVGDTLPVTTPFSDTSVPSANELFEIAARVTTPTGFGDEIARLFMEQRPDTEPTSTVYEMGVSDLVVVTRPIGAGGIEQTIHYYWLTTRREVTGLLVDQALQTTICSAKPEGTVCR